MTTDESKPPEARAARSNLPVLPSSSKSPPVVPEVGQLEGMVGHRVTPLDFGHAMHQSRPDFTIDQRALEGTIVEIIRTIYDPEIPVNIYDLGLIYEIDIDADRQVKVRMTLTAPGCPVAGSLPLEVEKKIENIPQVSSAEVELVWEPPWDKSRMSETALLDLGLL